VQILKRQWPVFLAFAAGIAMWLNFYVPTVSAQAMRENFTQWIRIIAGFAAILGVL
jgi:hypothetical protein